LKKIGKFFKFLFFEKQSFENTNTKTEVRILENTSKLKYWKVPDHTDYCNNIKENNFTLSVIQRKSLLCSEKSKQIALSVTDKAICFASKQIKANCFVSNGQSNLLCP
jgi:hypothetical protein